MTITINKIGDVIRVQGYGDVFLQFKGFDFSKDKEDKDTVVRTLFFAWLEETFNILDNGQLFEDKPYV